MKLIYERKTLVKAIPLMSLMAAINIIIAALSTLSVIVSIFLILILPLTSALVEICCKDRYFPIYAVATFGLSLALTFWNIDTTIFYVLPSIITGYIFGLLAKHKIPSVWAIFAATLGQTALMYALIPLVNFIFQVDVIMTFKTAFRVAEKEGIDIIVPTFIFLISLIQVGLSQMIVSLELEKFGVREEKTFPPYIVPTFGLMLSLLIIPFYFIRLEFAYLFLAMSIFFMADIIIETIVHKKYLQLIPYGVVVLLNVFLFALLNTYLKNGSQLLLIGFSSALICLISIVFSFLKMKKEKIQ